MPLLLAIALLATAGSGLAPVKFVPRAGWHVGAGKVHACPGVSPARCRQVSSFAATVRWRDCPGCLPHRTVVAMPAGGIAIHVTLAVERPLTATDTLRWPPRVGVGEVSGSFEGLPGRIGVYQRSGRVGRYAAQVYVFFGRSRPTKQQLAAANAELATGRLP